MTTPEVFIAAGATGLGVVVFAVLLLTTLFQPSRGPVLVGRAIVVLAGVAFLSLLIGSSWLLLEAP